MIRRLWNAVASELPMTREMYLKLAYAPYPVPKQPDPEGPELPARFASHLRLIDAPAHPSKTR